MEQPKDYEVAAFAAHEQARATFRMSAEINDLVLALSKFQGDVPPIPRKSTGHHGNKYAPLDTILDVVRPVLAKHELYLGQQMVGTSLGAKMVTLLAHSSGQFFEMRMFLQDLLDATMEIEQAKVSQSGKPYGMDPMQVLGSVTTYGRRYGVCAILGLSTEADLDGAGAQEPPNGRNTAKSTPKKAAKKTTRKSNRAAAAMTDAQRETIQKLAQDGNFSDDDLVKVCQAVAGVLPPELNFPNAEHLIDRLEKAIAKKQIDEEGQ